MENPAREMIWWENESDEREREKGQENDERENESDDG